MLDSDKMSEKCEVESVPETAKVCETASEPEPVLTEEEVGSEQGTSGSLVPAAGWLYSHKFIFLPSLEKKSKSIQKNIVYLEY